MEPYYAELIGQQSSLTYFGGFILQNILLFTNKSADD